MTVTATVPTRDNRPTVLFVDDERAILDALRRLSRGCDWDVLVAESGAAALDLLAHEESIDVVISDMRMPEMDGAEFLAAVARNFPDTVRMLLTGYADMESTVAAINDGKIFSYIPKPWDNNQLRNTIERGLEVRRLQMERDQLLDITQRQLVELETLNNSLEQKVKARTAELEQMMSFLDSAYEELKDSYISSVEVFARVIERHQGDDKGDNKSAAEHAQQVAEALQLETDDARQVYIATLLKDLGKIGLPQQLVTLPRERLNGDERMKFRRHPLAGEATLMAIPVLSEASRFIRHQFEQINGRGFPDKLPAEKIPLGAKILAAVRDYHDLIHGRLFDQSYAPDAAMEYLQQHCDDIYDSQVVNALVQVLLNERAHKAKQPETYYAAHELLPGMVLSRDLVSPDGVMLLARRTRLNSQLIAKINAYQEESQKHFPVYVLQPGVKSPQRMAS